MIVSLFKLKDMGDCGQRRELVNVAWHPLCQGFHTKVEQKQDIKDYSEMKKIFFEHSYERKKAWDILEGRNKNILKMQKRSSQL